MFGATAYEDRSISGEELLAKMHRLAQGECLMTGDVLPIQAARRTRLARLRQSIMRAASLADGSCPVTQEEDDSKPVSVSPLSGAERAVLEQIARGATNAQVAQALGISPYTVKNRLDVLFRKLSVCNRTAAVVIAIRKRWITLDSMHSLSL
jgi:DNA-binding NarL/FixJ family response regulator